MIDEKNPTQKLTQEENIKTSGEEIIKAEISQELIQARETFANFQISETTQEEITRKVEKYVNQMKNC